MCLKCVLAIVLDAAPVYFKQTKAKSVIICACNVLCFFFFLILCLWNTGCHGDLVWLFTKSTAFIRVFFLLFFFFDLRKTAPHINTGSPSQSSTPPPFPAAISHKKQTQNTKNTPVLKKTIIIIVSIKRRGDRMYLIQSKATPDGF